MGSPFRFLIYIVGCDPQKVGLQLPNPSACFPSAPFVCSQHSIPENRRFGSGSAHVRNFWNFSPRQTPDTHTFMGLSPKSWKCVLYKWKVELRRISVFFVCLDQGQFTCPKGHLSETYKHRVRFWVRVKVSFAVKFRNLHGSVSDK